jgi:hypothetical protein
MWDLSWMKWHWDWFSPSTSVFPRQHHSTNTNISFISHCQLYNLSNWHIIKTHTSIWIWKQQFLSSLIYYSQNILHWDKQLPDGLKDEIQTYKSDK